MFKKKFIKFKLNKKRSVAPYLTIGQYDWPVLLDFALKKIKF